MRSILIALSLLFGIYTVVVYNDLGEGGERPDRAARHGMRLWQEQNCQSCHQFYGLGGYMGPDLTNVASRRGEAVIRTFVRHGTGRMPAHELTEEEMDDLIAFLRWVDRSGSTRVPDSAVHWTGTYILEER